MITKTRRTLRLLSRRLWVRASMFSLIGLGAASLGFLVAPFLPDDISTEIGADAADTILGIVASSMLAVTTFSLSTVVSAFGAATSNVTPRATKLLIEDRTAQNTLAVFVGTFLYSLATLVLLSTGAYGEKGRLVLFAVTLVVILFMVATLLRWIDYLLRFGRVGETTRLVEEAAAEAIRDRVDTPFLGGRPLLADTVDSPSSRLTTTEIGYVQHIDMEALQAAAEKAGCQIAVNALPGSFVDPSRSLATAFQGSLPDDLRDEVLGAFTFDRERSFDQDPRFGLIVLAEIASRALSPGINDQGTAIDVLGRIVRLLAIWAEKSDAEVIFTRISVPPLTIEELLDDALSPIARDSVSVAEVQIRLQKTLQHLHALGDDRMKAATKAHAQSALRRAIDAEVFADDLERIRDAADWAR